MQQRKFVLLCCKDWGKNKPQGNCWEICHLTDTLFFFIMKENYRLSKS